MAHINLQFHLTEKTGLKISSHLRCLRSDQDGKDLVKFDWHALQQDDQQSGEDLAPQGQ